MLNCAKKCESLPTKLHKTCTNIMLIFLIFENHSNTLQTSNKPQLGEVVSLALTAYLIKYAVFASPQALFLANTSISALNKVSSNQVFYCLCPADKSKFSLAHLQFLPEFVYSSQPFPKIGSLVIRYGFKFFCHFFTGHRINVANIRVYCCA